ncbi:MAG: DNA-3-methyladenine glycosylase [Bryobacteraceae bacterium]|nr:DNA-3-methyladenine glycosylase [Bryobacteraceae bacterium]
MRKALNHLRSSDPVLAAIIAAVGPCRIQYREPTFEALVRSIIYQQLSGKAAGTIYARFAESVGEMTPKRLAKRTVEDLRPLGLSGQKAKYVLDLAEKTRTGLVRFQDLPALDDQAVIAHLTQVKGVGVWTVQMFLMFALRRPDVLPTGDLGIRNAVQRAYGLPEPPSPERLAKIAEPWRPHATIASWYLWRSLDGDAAV